MNASWREAFRQRKFIVWLIFAGVTLLMLGLFVKSYFETVILNRPGWVIRDIVLEQFSPVDWSLEILTLLYTALIISFVSNYKKPWNVLLGFSTYAIVTWLRMLSIYMFTLEAPVGVIPLSDPFLSLVVYDRSDFVKDLFFSGHVSTVSVLVVIETHRKVRWVLIVLSLAMTVFILWQHVHFTIDVVVAPLVTFVVYWVLKRWFIKTPQPG